MRTSEGAARGLAAQPVDHDAGPPADLLEAGARHEAPRVRRAEVPAGQPQVVGQVEQRRPGDLAGELGVREAVLDVVVREIGLPSNRPRSASPR